ncbi:MAG TPA: SDR family oxidoreductase [Tepidiformaceae bacterium]|nr:SDR family oxidoreductase [Tepidiformaceae bacterium]
MSLSGRVALISGGGRGIGRAIALGLAEDGAAVAVNYRRDEEAARETVAAIEKAGGKAKAYAASVDSWDDDEAMVKAALADFGHIDILVNNAGIASRGNSVADTDPAEMERVVRTHAFGSFYLSKLVLPSMREQPRGDIIMISSVAAQSLGGNGSPYNMGKAAVEALAQTLYKEERRHNIHVNIVAPGLVETEMGKRLARATRGTQDIRELDAVSPFGRVCQPEDVANVVRYLVSEQASYLTGQRVQVDGGGALPGAY